MATTPRPANRGEAVVGTLPRLATTSTLDQLFERFGDAARRAGAAHGLSGDDLDEVLQDVRIRLWHAGRASATIDSMTSSYIYRAAASAAIDLLRRRRARREERVESDAEFETAAHAAAPDDAVISAETMRAVDDALDDIPGNRRAVVRMYLKGYAREEIASLLGWTEAKTRNLLYRGLEDLRQRLIVRGIHP